MSVMPYWLSLGGDIIPKLDQALGVLEIQAAVVDGIERGYSILELARMYTTLTKLEIRHLERHWFKEWWPNHQPVEPILTEALKLACQKGLSLQKPVGLLWTCHHPAQCSPERWECGIASSVHQISLVIATPEPPTLPGPVATTEEDVWIVRGA